MASLDDRTEGVLLGTAAGDALDAPYEFQPPRGPKLTVATTGGGGWEAGEWTDDTAMAVAIAELAANGADLRDESTQDALVTRWLEWSRSAKDVGIQTRSVLRSASIGTAITAQRPRAASAHLHEQSRRTAGNGSLMRTAPVALAYLEDEAAMVQAARAMSELTHFDRDAGDACVLWCSAIRHAVLTGQLDVRVGLGHLDSERRGLWSKRLDAAENAPPKAFPNNGWVVSVLQAAWSANATTPVLTDDPAAGTFRADHVRWALDAAVRAGYDTGTVAAIATPHLDFVLLEAVRGVERFRGDGRKVLLHCVEALSRTPSVAALYGARLKGVVVDEAWRAVTKVLPDAWPNGAFRVALGRLGRSDNYIGPRVT